MFGKIKPQPQTEFKMNFTCVHADSVPNEPGMKNAY